jgi:type VI secretion system secreted protein VgrG
MPETRPFHQHYFVQVLGFADNDAFSVQSFEARERLGEPYRIEVVLTHPQRLPRDQILGKQASFRMQPIDGQERRFTGCITAWRRMQRTQDEHVYRALIEPQVARLRQVQTCRIFQQQDVQQIIEAILRRHELLGHQFCFKLRRAYPQHAFRLQYRISDWDYIRVLMEQEGIYCYFEQSEYGDRLVFADDVDHYLYQPSLSLPYREATGLNAGDEAILSLQTHASMVPQSYRVADYNPDLAWERFVAEANIAYQDKTTYGQPYVYGTGHLNQAQAEWEAQLRHEAAIAAQVVHEGISTSMDLRPARVVHTDEELDDTPHGMVITQVLHAGARDQAYSNTFQAIPADRRFRLPLNEAAWPKIAGTLSARVTSPGQYQYAYLTQAGCYVVRLDLDFDPWNPGGECVPLRLAKPFAGKRQTGMHFPALDGDEAIVEFLNGNPNTPYIAAFQHNSIATDLVTSQDRLLSRNRIVTQSGNEMDMEDWLEQEHVRLSTPHSGTSQLTLGHMPDRERRKRGAGFELRTDGQGAVRAGGGLLLSADIQQRGNGLQTDMAPALRQMQALMRELGELREAARQSEAVLADLNAQNAWLRDSVQKLNQVLAISAPNGVAVSTPERVAVMADRDIGLATQATTHINAIRNVLLNAGRTVSIFAAKLGITLRAAKGNIDIQAQTGAMDVLAQQQMRIASTTQNVVVAGKTQALFACGGVSLTLENGNAVFHCPGEFRVKAGSYVFEEAASTNTLLPTLRSGKLQLTRTYPLTF